MKSLYFLLCLAAFCGDSALAASPSSKEPGAMLAKGTWDGGVGTYYAPDAFKGLKSSRWPINDWFSFVEDEEKITISRVAPINGKAPQFLQAIIKEVSIVEKGGPPKDDLGTLGNIEQSNNNVYRREFFLRVPRSNLRAKVAPTYKFLNGTSTLRPKIDHRYELFLKSQEFAFTLKNGLISKSGVPYGGAHFKVEYDGKSFEYFLGQGPDLYVSGIADLDGDGKPDFLIHANGNNSGYEYVLLSTTAKPGKNKPTASLYSTGC